MGSEEQAAELFGTHGLEEIARVSDPDARLYRAFGLAKGNVVQLFGPAVWTRGVAALLGGHGIGRPIGDPLQMPGVFLVQNGRIRKAFRHESIGDMPDYTSLASCPLPSPSGKGQP